MFRLLQGPGMIGSIGLLILRIGFGGMMLVGHGLGKLKDYEKMKPTFADPMGWLQGEYALMALIGAEFACAALIVVGLLTRFAALPLVYAMGVAAFVVHKAHPVFFTPQEPMSKELALLYMLAFATLIFTGPGKFAIDTALFGRRADVMRDPL